MLNHDGDDLRRESAETFLRVKDTISRTHQLIAESYHIAATTRKLVEKQREPRVLKGSESGS